MPAEKGPRRKRHGRNDRKERLRAQEGEDATRVQKERLIRGRDARERDRKYECERERERRREARGRRRSFSA